jgi:hypothetical protein
LAEDLVELVGGESCSACWHKCVCSEKQNHRLRR